jgi:hypothetical protein
VPSIGPFDLCTVHPWPTVVSLNAGTNTIKYFNNFALTPHLDRITLANFIP